MKAKLQLGLIILVLLGAIIFTGYVSYTAKNKWIDSRIEKKLLEYHLIQKGKLR